MYHGPHDDFVVDEEKEEGEEEEEEMGEDKRRRRGRRGERGLLPLLLSCRKIYTEAITVLYGDNRFSLLHLESLISLQETILPRRLNAIRYLELGWYFYVPYPLYTRTTFQEARGPIREPMKQYPPYDIATWERVWAILAQMEGLTELRVDLVGRWIEPLTREEEGWLLEPAMAVRRPRVWEVRVDWEGVGVDWEARGAPFRVVRGGGSGGEGSERESGVWNA